MWDRFSKPRFTKHAIIIFLVIFFTPSLIIPTNVVTNNPSTNEIILNLTKTINLELSTPTELESFLDSIIPEQLTNYSIAGATFSMVKDGSIFFEKGYGYANSVYKSPVVANETLFRIGSISKTFTSIAVLQLVEKGLLDLDTDINSYLSAFKIPETYEESITLRHLLTHTAGFERAVFTVIHAYGHLIEPLEDLLAEGMPDRV